MKRGDFSGFPDIIYDPATIQPNGTRLPFAGNRIPANRANPVAVQLLGYYPDPTRPGLSNNLLFAVGEHGPQR